MKISKAILNFHFSMLNCHLAASVTVQLLPKLQPESACRSLRRGSMESETFTFSACMNEALTFWLRFLKIANHHSPITNAVIYRKEVSGERRNGAEFKCFSVPLCLSVVSR
jgi:hypothetical protein